MLDAATVKKIIDFVFVRPRTIQEIAEHIDKNWRTADRYVQEIQEEQGTLSTRVFREGTRGALKVVYGVNAEKISNTVAQQILEDHIFKSLWRDDFSPFDIFQYVPENNKQVWSRQGKGEDYLGTLDNLRDLLLQTEKQLLLFSGNLSFVFYKDKKIDIFSVFEELVKRGVSIKVVCRVDLTGLDNIKRLLSLNFKYGKELIEIHHKQQPLRCTVVDKKFFNIKEVFTPTSRNYELQKKTYVFYTINEKEWLDWITKIFWKMFSHSIDAGDRIEQWNKVKDSTLDYTQWSQSDNNLRNA